VLPPLLALDFFVWLNFIAEHTDKIEHVEIHSTHRLAPPASLKNAVLLQLHHADWPIADSRAGLYLHGLCLPSSSHGLSCLLHLLINLVIALAGMAADGDPLGSGRAPTGDAAEPSSPFTLGSAR